MLSKEVDLNCFDYALPEHLIAQKPIALREKARLLVVDRKTGTWKHQTVSDLPELLGSPSHVVVNNSRVLKARLRGYRLLGVQGNQRRGGGVEFFLLKSHAHGVWEGMLRSSASVKPGFEFQVPVQKDQFITAVVTQQFKEGTVLASFDQDPVQRGVGEVPLPPYIRRRPEDQDQQDYQTIYAKKEGSVAAPTAGLHLTASLIQRMQQRGIQFHEVTLHIGLGTFRPVKVQDVRQHPMHEEAYEVTPDVAQTINQCKQVAEPLIAIGTTVVRALESAWEVRTKRLRSGLSSTRLLIYPGSFQFCVVDQLFTNFHLPKSTLLMLVCAFAGRELILSAYQEAIRHQYRFFSYGDAMLIL